MVGELVGELVGPEVGPVVGDDLVDGDADALEPQPCPVEEPDQGVGGLVVERLDIGQAGVVVYGDVQVAVADPGPLDRTLFFGPLVMRVFSGCFVPIGRRIRLG